MVRLAATISPMMRRSQSVRVISQSGKSIRNQARSSSGVTVFAPEPLSIGAEPTLAVDHSEGSSWSVAIELNKICG